MTSALLALVLCAAPFGQPVRVPLGVEKAFVARRLVELQSPRYVWAGEVFGRSLLVLDVRDRAMLEVPLPETDPRTEWRLVYFDPAQKRAGAVMVPSKPAGAAARYVEWEPGSKVVLRSLLLSERDANALVLTYAGLTPGGRQVDAVLCRYVDGGRKGAVMEALRLDRESGQVTTLSKVAIQPNPIPGRRDERDSPIPVVAVSADHTLVAYASYFERGVTGDVADLIVADLGTGKERVRRKALPTSYGLAFSDDGSALYETSCIDGVLDRVSLSTGNIDARATGLGLVQSVLRGKGSSLILLTGPGDGSYRVLEPGQPRAAAFSYAPLFGAGAFVLPDNKLTLELSDRSAVITAQENPATVWVLPLAP